MRICIVSSEYPPFHGGGIGTYSAIQSRALAEAGHDVHVICNHWGDYSAAEPDGLSGPVGGGCVTVHRLDVLTTAYTPRPPHDADSDPVGQVCRYWDSSLYWSMNVADELARLHRQAPLDVVEYPEAFAESYVAMRRRRLGDSALDIPMTLTLHSPMHEVIEYNRYRRSQAWVHRRNMMEEYCITHADTLCSPSRHLVATLRRRMGAAFDRVPCTVIPNPMEFSAWDHPGGEARPLPDAEAHLLYVGRIEPRKGIRDLADAAIQVMAQVPGLRVVLIGRDCDAGEVPGSMKDFVLQRLPAEFRSRFIFEGIRPRHEILRRYGAATACVFPVPWDNFPYTCCEAMASGGCVIASSNSGMAEMIEDGSSGILFHGGDVPALTAAIFRVLGDAGLRARLQREAPRRIRTLCDPALATGQRLAHYEQTIRRYRMNRPQALASATAAPARLALFVAGGNGEEADVRVTLESVRDAADAARVSLDATAGGRGSPELRRWVDSLSQSRPDYLLVLDAGERLERSFLNEVIAAFGREPSIAWTTTWAFSLDPRQPRPFAGFDFSVPLELLYYHPVPFAVIAYDAFQRVGGWNLDLPAGWRMWDLFLALEQAGLAGVVVPKWLAHYSPQAGRGLEAPHHGKAHELILEAVAARNRVLFAEHAVAMYVNLAVNPRHSSPAVNLVDQASLPAVDLADRTAAPGVAPSPQVARMPDGLRKRIVGKTIDWLQRWA